MTTKTLSAHQAMLVDEREALLTELSHLRDVIASEVDLEPDEGDEQITEHETAAILLGILELRLLDIDAKLAAIEHGSYSLCERCNRPIEADRLAAKPDARYCIKCQKTVERIVQQHQVPVLPIKWELFVEG
jgi:RNA polymerase-binding transcription factor DksA